MRKINYTITSIEGIHIGTAYDRYEKGAIDSYTIKDFKGYPYIPATSIKGKVRFFLDNLTMFEPDEKLVSKIGSDILNSDQEFEDTQISKALFGSTEDKENKFEFNSMKKILFKDAKLVDTVENPELLFEVKAENSIEISENTAEVQANPRIIERTIPGLKYKFELIIVGFENEETIVELFDFVFACIQDYGYIGGSGSRGYGQVEISRGEQWFIKSK